MHILRVWCALAIVCDRLWTREDNRNKPPCCICTLNISRPSNQKVYRLYFYYRFERPVVRFYPKLASYDIYFYFLYIFSIAYSTSRSVRLIDVGFLRTCSEFRGQNRPKLSIICAPWANYKIKTSKTQKRFFPLYFRRRQNKKKIKN